MSDVAYLVCYDGAHKTNILCATSNEQTAINEANQSQGFRVEKWEDGRMVQYRFYDGGKQGE